ncbi:hypothetical protein T11_210 [Trichinella zimbabwensis]|uniref:Uncharacterized protein n=1 Tax=Trichinella zimbabwensis TaxID=268475 RepID=A0A0V1H1I2_9BILA|nr:hypothetical protein T11_210 [Trichinella zimbabwensis]
MSCCKYFDLFRHLSKDAINVRIRCKLDRWSLLLLHEASYNVDLSSSGDDYSIAWCCSNKQESSTTGANRPFNEDMVNAINNEKIEQLTPHSSATAGIDSQRTDDKVGMLIK